MDYLQPTLPATETQTLDPQNPTPPQTLAPTDTPNSTGSIPNADENGGATRRRRSRWDPPEADGEPKKRKSRWAEEEPKPPFQLPDFMRDFTGDSDPEIQALNARLLEISRILQAERSGIPLDDRPEGARSPSPEPVYDNLGVRINTREFRARERLNRERQEIIAQIIKRNPAFKPPADYRPPKLHKKLYIPMKEYPGYNFIGLIIGPRGNTQKRMEKETGAKIVIRGKGSLKEGRLGQKRDLKWDPAENEDLHVLVEAETEEALEAAAGMVEKLLRPVDEGLNEHKRQQLRELATLNGTIKEDEFCRLCGESGHRQFACPSRFSTFKSDVLCTICGDGGHPTIDCPVKGTVGKKMDDEYQSFLAELGGSGPEPASKPGLKFPTLAIMGPNGSGASAHPGLGSTAIKVEKEIDDTNLYIGYLPSTMEDDALIRLFQPFGEITKAKVIKDRDTGLSKGYGFVKYSTIAEAKTAIEGMNGHRLDGRAIAVRVAGMPPQPVVPPGPPSPAMTRYPPPGQPMGGYPSQQGSSGGPLGSIPPGGYMSAPVPWGQPPPPPYAPFSAPLPGGNMYPPPGQHIPPPYSVHYPPPPQPQSAPSSEFQESTAPGVPAQSNMYGSLGTSQPMYHSPYPSYYAMPPPPPQYSLSSSNQQNFAGAPWTYNPPAPPPPPVPTGTDKSQQLSSGGDAEYEKFMAEMK